MCLKSRGDDGGREKAKLCLLEQETEAEQGTSEKCNSSRIAHLLSCRFVFPRNAEMDVPGLGSPLSVLRAAPSRGLARSEARLPLLQGSRAGGQTTASSAAARAGAGWRASPGSALASPPRGQRTAGAGLRHVRRLSVMPPANSRYCAFVTQVNYRIRDCVTNCRC